MNLVPTMAGWQAKRAKSMLRADRAFLPGALEVLETPAAPLAAVLIGTICVLFAAALAWSWFGRIDVIAVAQGKVQPQGRVKTVQSLRTGRVLEIVVADGASVREGELLLRLDPRDALAERTAALAELEGQEAHAVRRRAAIAAVDGMGEAAARAPGPPPIAFPPGTPAAIRDREARTLAADLASLSAGLGRNAAQIGQKQAEKRRLDAVIEAQRGLVAVVRERVDMRQTLIKKSAGTRGSLIDAQEALATQTAVLAQEEGQTAEIEASLIVIEREAAAAQRSFVADNAQKLGEAERQIAVLRQRLARADLDLEQTRITSPVAGVVQSSLVSTGGQVVNAGEDLMRIVPDGGVGVEIECYLPNQDIGFVRPGQQAVVKIESFPFTRYGTIDAEVVRVAQDAIPESDASLIEQAPLAGRRSGKRVGADRIQNLVYPVTLRPLRPQIDIDGVARELRPGMALTVEIKTGERRLIDYVLSPVRQIAFEALTER